MPPPINQTITQTSELSKKIPKVSKIEKKVVIHPDFTTPVQSVNSPTAEAINRMAMIKNISIYPDPTYGLHLSQQEFLHQKVQKT